MAERREEARLAERRDDARLTERGDEAKVAENSDWGHPFRTGASARQAGFGADLGAEKFVDIKCRKSGLRFARKNCALVLGEEVCRCSSLCLLSSV